jgi:transposase
LLQQEVKGLIQTAIDDAAGAAKPPEPDSPPKPEAPPRWTLARLVQWIQQVRGITYSEETIRQVLHRLGFSWKKARKLLAKANPAHRQAFLVDLAHQLQIPGRPVVVYCDEAHVHQDTDGGYGWGPKGKTFWVQSSSPGLSKKVTFYGLYLLDEPQPLRIWSYPRGNTDSTIQMLRRLREELPGRPILMIWDGASYHRSGAVLAEAARLNIKILRLPAYSPDFMPVESLWRWLRQEVTYHRCHHTPEELITRVDAFVHKANQDPDAVACRLHVASHLDPEVEKLRFSNWG